MKKLPVISCSCFQSGISRLALGCLAFGWYLSKKNSFQILDRYIELGGNLIDTSDNYARWVPGKTGGESESVIGSWLKIRRNVNRPFIATKVGYETETGSGLSKTYIKKAVDSSLKRLRLDYIDLYQLHCTDPNTSPFFTAEALLELQNSGKIKAVGLCNMQTSDLKKYLNAFNTVGIENIFTHQFKLNYLERDRMSSELLHTIPHYHMVGMVYGILARGFLTGKYRRVFDPSVSFRAESVYRKYYNKDSFLKLDKFLQNAEKRGKSPSFYAYQWVNDLLLKNKIRFVFLGGFTSIQQLDQAADTVVNLENGNTSH
ncbi:aldo/keto reductase [candidate division KSB1 bacterium]|nr:aldo/keto reductase [candidate division KSB1 bacterium]